MRTILFFTLFFFLGSCKAQSDSLIKTDLVIGQELRFFSEILEEERVLNVYIPEGYHADQEKSYPVIYLLDGSMNEDFLHIAGLVQFASMPWIKMLPPSIVVGVANTNRYYDFTYPSKGASFMEIDSLNGGSAYFIRFLISEVKPMIQSAFRTDSEYTIIGQSLGGLLATEILSKHPESFNNYIIISPSLWWDNESLLKKDFSGLSKVQHIYIAVGKEGEVMERVAGDLAKKLKDESNGEVSIHFENFSDLNHRNILHQAVYMAFDKMKE